MLQQDHDSPKATRREWIGLAAIALPCVLYSMDLTVLNLAVPHLTADLKPSASQLLWIMDIYGFFVAGFLITMGTLGDRIGRRRLLLIGAGAFGLASVVAAFSSSAQMLIVTRAVLGIAAATLAPSTLSLIRNMFLDPKERTLAIGIWATSYSVGGAIGPMVGGVLLEHFWWGSVFLVSVPVMVVLLAVGPALLPEFRDPNAGKLDLCSAALSLGAVLSVIYGLKRMAESGVAVIAILWIVIGIAIAIGFVLRQRRLADPLIDLRLFAIPAFSAALSVNLLAIFVAFGIFFFIAQHLQLVLGFSAFEAGLWTLPSSFGFIIGSMVAPAIVKRVDRSMTIVGGVALTAVGAVILTQASAGLAVLVTGAVIMALGMAPAVTLATDVIVSSAPPERAGAASAVSETGAEAGGALGIALLGSGATAIYRGVMNDAALEGLAPAAVETARGTLGGALSLVDRLPATLGAELQTLARAAFVQAFELMSAISALLMVVTAAGVWLVLRKRPAGGQSPNTEPESANVD